jgi:hypothetical protein
MIVRRLGRLIVVARVWFADIVLRSGTSSRTRIARCLTAAARGFMPQQVRLAQPAAPPEQQCSDQHGFAYGRMHGCSRRRSLRRGQLRHPAPWSRHHANQERITMYYGNYRGGAAMVKKIHMAAPGSWRGVPGTPSRPYEPSRWMGNPEFQRAFFSKLGWPLMFSQVPAPGSPIRAGFGLAVCPLGRDTGSVAVVRLRALPDSRCPTL